MGAQAKAIANFEKGKKKFFEIVATVDWDARSIITYAQIHHNVLSDVDKILKKNQLSSPEKINFFFKKFWIVTRFKKAFTNNKKRFNF
ncbi:hypothetical protein R7X17_00255 [Mesomycoplasma ovipneumoniae]|nr:hypothetical protein [Mesomycoplasma ovipneumoniae]